MVKNAKKTLIFSIFISILLLLTALILVGCGEQKVKAESVSFAKKDVRLYPGQIYYSTFSINPENANDYIVGFSSSAPDVVSVDGDGLFTAIKEGSATITILIKDTSLSDTCNVVVDDGGVTYCKIDYSRTSLRYYDGEKINEEDVYITGTAYIANGDEVKLSNEDFTIDCPPIAKPGCVIKVSYREWSTELPIRIVRDKPVSLEIATPPENTNYFIGESFNPEGLTLKLTFASGRVQTISEFTYSQTPIEIGQKFVEVYFEDFEPVKVAIKASARKSVRTFQELQTAINENAETIELLGQINTPTPLVIKDAQNITIFALNQGEIVPSINGQGVCPIKIENSANIKFIGISILTSEKNGLKTENLIDLTDCTSAKLTFEDVVFSTSQENVSTSYDKDLIKLTYTNCTFNKE